MDKKKLRSLDLDQLESNFDKNFDEQVEEIIEGSSLKELEAIFPDQKSSLKKKISLEGELKNELIKYQDKRLLGKGKEQLLDYVTKKYRFDKKEHNFFSYAIAFFLFIGFYKLASLPVQGIENPFNIIGSLLVHDLYSLFKNYYILIYLFICIFIPFKHFTRTQVEIFYEGLNVPLEVSPMKELERRRVLWSQIQRVEFIKVRDLHVVSLIGKSDKKLGQIRLDLDNMKGFYMALEDYAPISHPIREIIPIKKS